MKDVALLLIVLCCLALVGPVSASAEGIPLPPEWEGIWSNIDSVYDCNTLALTKVVSQNDTLCAGELVGDDPHIDPPFGGVTCSGTGDATHLQSHCAVSGLCGEACGLDYTSDLDATRSAETAFWLWTTKFQSTIPTYDKCSLTRRHGTRIQAGPLAVCGSVPSKPLSWGGVKAHYR